MVLRSWLWVKKRRSLGVQVLERNRNFEEKFGKNFCLGHRGHMGSGREERKTPTQGFLP